MARGWESKSVEEQQALASATTSNLGPRLTPDQLARQHRQQGLKLARRSVLQQLKVAQNPHHRCMLEAALADLEVQLAQLG